jgi:hypothetical protein
MPDSTGFSLARGTARERIAIIARDLAAVHHEPAFHDRDASSQRMPAERPMGAKLSRESILQE